MNQWRNAGNRHPAGTAWYGWLLLVIALWSAGCSTSTPQPTTTPTATQPPQPTTTATALQPGALVNVLLPAAAADPAATPAVAAAGAAPALLVPPSAVIHDAGHSYVWLQTGERQFRRARITTAESSAGAVAVTAGVRPGDRVVTAGAYLLQSEFTLRQGAPTEMSGMAM